MVIYTQSLYYLFDITVHLSSFPFKTTLCQMLGLIGLGPGSRRVSNGLTNIRRATKVFGRKLRGHVGFVGCFCSEVC